MKHNLCTDRIVFVILEREQNWEDPGYCRLDYAHAHSAPRATATVSESDNESKIISRPVMR
jgi:hypothetical protein